jgi:DNA polymerase (family 10)
MQASNAEIARELGHIADLLEIEGANPFRARAYRRAARIIDTLPREVTEMLAAGANLDDLPGIGEDLAAKIATLASGRHPPLLDELERELPPSLTALLALPGLGPKRVKLLHDRLGIADQPGLEAALRAGRLHDVAGFGPGIEARLLQALAQGAGTTGRMLLRDAERVAEPLLRRVRAIQGVVQADLAGSCRRRRETVGDLDIVAACRDTEAVMAAFVRDEAVARVFVHGPTRASVMLRQGVQADLRAVPPTSHGAALLYFTGSKAHNLALRRLAIGQGWKLNEYGLFDGRRPIAGTTEAEIYRRLGLAFVPPELREDQGEIEAASHGRLPRLVTLADLRGDLHAHTTASDGRAGFAAMAEAARARGYGYLAITDHSRRLAMAHGLGPRQLAAQAGDIRRLNAGAPAGLTLLSGIEVDILEDGSLDLPDSALAALDLAVGAIHSHFDLPPERQTERLLRAMRNPWLDIIAHPTGRLLNRRPGYTLDTGQVFRAAAACGCAFEINAQPDRLDLPDTLCRLARETRVNLAVSTDAHGVEELDFMRHGIDQARRGWLRPGDVLNTRPLPELRKLLRRNRHQGRPDAAS